MMPMQDIPDATLVTPGVIGFTVTALIAGATILLLWDLNRRIRDIRFRAEAQDAIALEQAEAEAAAASGTGQAAGTSAAAAAVDRDATSAGTASSDDDASQHDEQAGDSSAPTP